MLLKFLNSKSLYFEIFFNNMTNEEKTNCNRII